MPIPLYSPIIGTVESFLTDYRTGKAHSNTEIDSDTVAVDVNLAAVGGTAATSFGMPITAAQYVDSGNSATITSSSSSGHVPGTPFTGAWYQTRIKGIQECLTLLTAFNASNLPISTLSFTFTFQGSDNGTDVTVSRAVTVTAFAAARLFHTTDWLSNQWEYYRVIMTPSRNLVAGETIVISTRHSMLSGNKFLYPMDYAFLENAQATPIVRNFATAIQPDGDIVNARANGTVFTYSTALLAGASMPVSTVFDWEAWNGAELIVKTDQISASEGIVVEANPEGTASWIPIRKFTYGADDVARGFAVFVFPTSGKNCRISYQNGGVNQGSFLIQLGVHEDAKELARSSIESSITSTATAIMSRSMMFAKNAAGTYGNIERGTSGGLDVGIVQHEVETPIKSLSSFIVTRVSVTTTAALVFTPNANCRSWTAKAIASSGRIVYVAENNAKATAGNGFPLSNSEWVGGDLSSGTLHASCDTGTQALAIFEVLL